MILVIKPNQQSGNTEYIRGPIPDGLNHSAFPPMLEFNLDGKLNNTFDAGDAYQRVAGSEASSRRVSPSSSLCSEKMPQRRNQERISASKLDGMP